MWRERRIYSKESSLIKDKESRAKVWNSLWIGEQKKKDTNVFAHAFALHLDRAQITQTDLEPLQVIVNAVQQTSQWNMRSPGDFNLFFHFVTSKTSTSNAKFIHNTWTAFR